MTFWEAALLVVGGTFAGAINTVAGGGSTLTVPLLVLAGVPGNVANGSNRVGVITSNAAAATSFKRLGVDGFAHALPVLGPVVAGSLLGSLAISRLTDDAFETVFGLIMIPLIILSIRRPQFRTDGARWSRTTTSVVFFAIGIYGGAIQAGVGLVLLAALTRAGTWPVAPTPLPATAICCLSSSGLAKLPRRWRWRLVCLSRYLSWVPGSLWGERCC